MDHKNAVIDRLAEIIAFPTVSAVSNLALLDHVKQLAEPLGARIRTFPSAEGDKANLLVSLGPDVPGGVVLSGHTDVVPVEGQAWGGDPWTLRQIGSRLVARGTTDMKGFLACCLAIMPGAAAKPLKRPLHLAFSYDEEVGCTGVGEMAEWIGKSGLSPRFAMIGEATGMDLVAAHKGGLIGWARLTGKPGHSSQPDRYVNAVMTGAELVCEINRIRAEMREGPRFEGLDPPYSTIQVNIINGGLHGNIVAQNCDFFWEMRIIPGQEDLAVLERIKRFAAERLEPAMKAVDPACGIAIEVQSRIPGLRPESEALTAEALALLGRDTPRYVSYGTEAGIFQNAGVPAFVAGPGNIADAHQPDEGIELSELHNCIDVLDRIVDSCCRPL